MGGLHGSAGKPRGAVSVTRGAESATRRIMWSVLFVFLSYLDRNFVKGDFLDAEKESNEMFSMLNGTFCAKMSSVGENLLYQVSDGAEVVRSIVSPSGMLVNCTVIVNQMQVKSFMHACRLGLKEQRAVRQLEPRFTRMDEAKLVCHEFRERSGRSVKREDRDDSSLQNEVLKRSKRGFTYPGTLWCGAGNMADNYEQLGRLYHFYMFQQITFCVHYVFVPGLLSVTSSLQETLQRPTAAAEFTTTVLTSSTPSPPTTATPTSSGTPSVTVTVILRE